MKHFASFAEAMREGTKLTPVGTKMNLLNQRGGTCALGAGLFAMGYENCRTMAYGLAEKAYPYLNELGFTCPSKVCPCGQANWTLGTLVYHLFDCHDWSREAVADWLFLEEEKLGFETLTTEEENKETECHTQFATVTSIALYEITNVEQQVSVSASTKGF